MARRTKIETHIQGQVTEVTHHQGLKQIKVQVSIGNNTRALVYIPDEHIRAVLLGDDVHITMFVQEPDDEDTRG